MFRNISRGLSCFSVFVLVAGAVCFGGYKAVKITYTISGTTGVGGVVMAGLPGDPVCEADGSYSVTVEYGWKGRVAAVKEGFVFEPAELNYEKVVGNQVDQNFSGALIDITISGSAGVIGAVMDGFDVEVVSDEQGEYAATVKYGWSGVITPVKDGYDFEPQFSQLEPVKENKTDQNFTAKLKSFSISGSTGLEGVVLKGFGEKIVTGSDGKYSVRVDYGWTGTVTPVFEGYTFDPAGRTYSKTVDEHVQHDYAADRIILTVSGNAGQTGVLMSGLGDNTVSDANGDYSANVDYDFSGTVEPVKEGYAFSPGSIEYSNLKRDKVNERYEAKLKTFLISGSAGMGGVVMKGLDGEPVTNEDGSYSVEVNYGWDGVVVPEKEGFSFDPAERAYENITVDQIDQGFAGEVLSYIISGVVSRDGVAVIGVVMDGLPGEPVTNEDGFYSVIVDYGWEGSFEAVKTGYTFEPKSTTYTKVTEDMPMDHAATLLRFAISGVITAGGEGLEGVVVKAGDEKDEAVTDEQGEYELFVDYGFSGSVRPEKDGYIISPSSRFTKVTEMASEREYGRVVEDQINQDYNAAILKFTIFGTVDIGGEPVEGVLMTASNGGETSLTGVDGKYLLTVAYGWSGGITPSKEGYMFDPPSIEYENVTSDIDEDARIEETEELIDAAGANVGSVDEGGDGGGQEIVLDVRIVAMGPGDLLGMGFEWREPKIKAGIVADAKEDGSDEQAENAKCPWGIKIGVTPEDGFSEVLDGILGDLEKAGRANIISSPEVSTREGESTEIKVTTEAYYSSDAGSGETDGAGEDGEDVEKVEYETLLSIVPQVSVEGDILLKLSIEVSEVAIRGEKSQVVARRVVNDTVRVKDGGTVLVAGLKNDANEGGDEEVAIFVTGRTR